MVTQMSTATLVCHAVPPSLNKIGSRGKSHWAYTHAKREWQEAIGRLLMAERVPRGLGHVHADATLRFPVVRTRDAGNFAWLLDKATGDALKTGGWLTDDTPEYYEFGTVTFDRELGPPCTTLRLAYST
jgi:hypothetical protein